ncbi:MAG TPA: hypothetical protein VII38_23925, partial [Polyangia bacterium]
MRFRHLMMGALAAAGLGLATPAMAQMGGTSGSSAAGQSAGSMGAGSTGLGAPGNTGTTGTMGTTGNPGTLGNSNTLPGALPESNLPGATPA